MRLRITFSKMAALRYTGHLDLHRLWERAARRAGLPLSYSHGFHPLPRLQLASALPLGCSGRAEILDLWLEDQPLSDRLAGSPEACRVLLQSALPNGLTVTDAEQVDEKSPALQTLVEAAEYEVTLLDPPAKDLEQKLANLMQSGSLPRVRRGRSYDLRPLIERLDLRAGDGSSDPVLEMTLANRESATGRADEVLVELGIPLEATRIERKRLLFSEKPLKSAGR